MVKKLRLIFWSLPIYFFSLPAVAAGEELVVDASSLDDSAAAIYGQACEKMKQGELRSSVRMRATDKASFSAVKTLNGLNDFQPKASEHDFNVLIYNIVDNYVEDLAVRTTKQNQDEICVEVTGFVLKKNIIHAIEEAISSDRENLEESDDKEYQIAASEEEEHTQKAGEQTEGKHPEPENKLLYSPDAGLSEPSEVSLSQAASSSNRQDIEEDANEQRELVYIAPTEFFNNTSSAAHAQVLRDIFGKNTLFYVTDKKELADYVVSSKVLRAKVDPINNTTSRLQMVVSVGAEFVDSGSSSIEHQNRFILFSADDDEQQVAGKLMNKLLSKAGETILNKIESNARHNNKSIPSSPILTPVS